MPTRFRRPGPRITPRGPRVPTVRPAPALPWLGKAVSVPARMLARVMQQRGVRYQPEVVSGGGRNLPGGVVIDFVLPDYKIYLRVQGNYWHSSAQALAKDDVQKIVLQGKGYRVVDVWTKAIERDPEQAFAETVGRLV